MSLTRKCGACGNMIETKYCLSIHVSLLETDGPEIQDALEQAYDDYCAECVSDGLGIADLTSALTHWNPKAKPPAPRSRKRTHDKT